MRQISIYLTLLLVTFSLNSCSISFWAYIRNLTDSTATVDIYLNNPYEFNVLPTSLKTTNQVVKFKKGFNKDFIDTAKIVWLDSSHGKIEIQPNTTVDLESITYFFNLLPRTDIKMFVITPRKTDTLMTSRTDFRREKFNYKQIGFILPRPILYYDIKE